MTEALKRFKRRTSPRKIIFDEYTRNEIKHIKKYAEKNIITSEKLQDMLDKGGYHLLEKDKSRLVGMFNFVIVYSIEEHPIGLSKHLSVSISGTRAIPKEEVLTSIMEEFGFEEELKNCHIWIKEYEYHSNVNILQPVKEPVEEAEIIEERR